MRSPTQCVLWKKGCITPEDLNFKLLKVFISSTYMKRSLFECRECGQRYFHEWYEHINFNRDASMYDTYIPVDTDEEIDKLSKIENSEGLARIFPQLHGSFTNDGDECLKWITQEDETTPD